MNRNLCAILWGLFQSSLRRHSERSRGIPLRYL
jgi:hypothetical protein